MNTQLNLVSYNLCKAGAPGYGTWATLFDALAPDIFLAQESASPEQYMAAKARPFRPPTGSAMLGGRAGGNYWGSALFVCTGALTPIPMPEDLAGWVAGAAVTGLPTPGSSTAPLHIYSIHTPPDANGNYAPVVERILDCIGERSAGAALVMGGDFNITISQRRPDETLQNKASEKEIHDRLREEFRLINCWQIAHPEVPLARTLRHLYNAESPAYHSDGLFVPAAWRAALRSCEVLDQPFGDPPSDHNAVQAIFEWDSALP